MEFQHGGDIYRNPTEYDFSTNINPLGMPKVCVSALEEAISHVGEYPDVRGEKLCQAIAQAEGVEVDEVLLGNGAAELIYTLCYALRPQVALESVPTFSEYENGVVAAGGRMDIWDGEHLDAITSQVDLLFLCNPNNPTGAVWSKEQLLAAAQRCEDTRTYLCVDECFLPFLEEEAAYTMKQDLEYFPHLLVLRAFTKVYGMPGLRLGYILTANQNLLEKMRQCQPPWSTSVMAQAAGVAALQEKDFLRETREVIQQERAYLVEELRKGLAYRVYEPAANFIFFRSAPDLQKRLLRQGILIRDCSNYRGLQEGYFRIAVRNHEENQELIRRWRNL